MVWISHKWWGSHHLLLCKYFTNNKISVLYRLNPVRLLLCRCPSEGIEQSHQLQGQQDKIFLLFFAKLWSKVRLKSVISCNVPCDECLQCHALCLEDCKWSKFGLGMFRCVAVEHAFCGFSPEKFDCQAYKLERSGLRVRHKLSAEWGSVKNQHNPYFLSLIEGETMKGNATGALGVWPGNEIHSFYWESAGGNLWLWWVFFQISSVV